MKDTLNVLRVSLNLKITGTKKEIRKKQKKKNHKMISYVSIIS